VNPHIVQSWLRLWMYCKFPPFCAVRPIFVAAGQTGKAINVKKGQFLAPWDMKNVAAKIASTGNERIILCDRGTSFGYNTLVSDFRGLPIMAHTGYPVMFDATHSVTPEGRAPHRAVNTNCPGLSARCGGRGHIFGIYKPPTSIMPLRMAPI